MPKPGRRFRSQRCARSSARDCRTPPAVSTTRSGEASGRCSSDPSPTSPPLTWTAWSGSSSASSRRSSTGPTWSTAAWPLLAW